MSARDTFYEETGYRAETIWLKKLLYSALTAYPFFLIAAPLLYGGDVLAATLSLFSIALFIIGCVKLSVPYTCASVVVAAVVQKVFLGSFDPYALIAVISWMFLSEYAIDLMIKERSAVSRRSSALSAVYSLTALLIPVVYALVALLVANMIIGLHEHVLATTPEAFQLFYSIFLSTRVGSLLFIIIVLYLVYHTIDNYIYGLMNDLLFSTKKYAIDFARSFLAREFEDVLNVKDWFGKLFKRVYVPVAMFAVFSALYPLLELVDFGLAPTISALILSFLASVLVYKLLDIYLRKVFSIELRFSIKKGRRALTASAAALIAYVTFMVMLSPISSYDILSTAIGLKHGSNRTDLFSTAVSNFYYGLCEAYLEMSQGYVTNVIKAYTTIAELMSSVIRFTWG